MGIYSAMLSGFSLGFSLILAIGAQNAFVLQQGIRNQHVFWTCLCCALSDAVLIGAGVSGFAALISLYPWVDSAARYGGVVFLIAYGLFSFKSAVFGSNYMDYSEARKPQSLSSALLMCFAFTWLNPHVYLDTLFLIGSVSTQFEGQRIYFAFGAMAASFAFFFLLGYGSRRLTPLFAKPVAWRYFNAVIGLTMVTIAASLIF